MNIYVRKSSNKKIVWKDFELFRFKVIFSSINKNVEFIKLFKKYFFEWGLYKNYMVNIIICLIYIINIILMYYYIYLILWI